MNGFARISILTLAIGCASKMDEATVRSTFEAAFKEHNPTEGQYGWELVGKGQWFKGSMFSTECLKENMLAYPDLNNPGRLSPDFALQYSFTASTKRGYCIDMGSDLRPVIDSIEPVSELGSYDIQNVNFHYELNDASPWFGCFQETHSNRTIRVEKREDVPLINPDDVAKLAFQENNGCPQPVPKAVERKAKGPFTAEPSDSPSIEDVKKLAQAFDDALHAGEFDKAMKLVSCVNLLTEKPEDMWGGCVLGDFVAVGPSTHGESRAQDGAPWLEYAIYDLAKLEKVVADKEDKTLFHVLMTHRKTKGTRSFSVQWADGQWKLLGKLSIMGAGMTPVRLMNDLHESTNRDIFKRRLEGEAIDHKGNALDPNAEEEGE